MNEDHDVVVDLNPDRLPFLPIDPFAARPGTASRVSGLGGDHPSQDPGYVFQSLDLYPVLGPVHFLLQFHGLIATTGSLTVQIDAFSYHPGTHPLPLKEIAIPMQAIVEAGGLVRVDLISRRNMGYRIGGRIDDDTDAQAIGLSLSLYPREREAPDLGRDVRKPVVDRPDVTPVEGWVEKPELAVMRPARLACPVSQAMTPQQAADPLVAQWNAVLHQVDGNPAERWDNAIILQALHHYGVPTEAAAGLCIGGRPHRLPAYLAGRGCSILVGATHRGELPDGDPGLALEQLLHADLCAPLRFFEAVHLTLFDRLAIPAALGGFDFMWSLDACTGPDARALFPHMLRDSVRCLRPGGMAVHMLRYSGELGMPADPRSTSYGRAEIERMALSLVADGQEVAQLNFDTGGPDQPGDRHLGFALILRRTR